MEGASSTTRSVDFLPEARVGGHGYSILLVCLFVCVF